MPITTFLHDNELNQPTGNNEVDELLAKARQITGRNFQVVTTRRVVRFGFLGLRKRIDIEMSVYLEVGGVGPWQWLSCTHDVDTTSAYLIGILGGHTQENNMRMYNLKLGGRYNWKNQPERLIYLGNNLSGNGYWHQFAKVDSPENIWCEIKDSELHLLEETKIDNDNCFGCGIPLSDDWKCYSPYCNDQLDQVHESGCHEELIDVLAARLGIACRMESQKGSRYNEFFKRHVLKAAIRKIEKIGA